MAMSWRWWGGHGVLCSWFHGYVLCYMHDHVLFLFYSIYKLYDFTLSSSIYYVMVVSDGRCMHHPWRKKSLNFFLLSKENLLGNSELRLATWYVNTRAHTHTKVCSSTCCTQLQTTLTPAPKHQPTRRG